MTTSIDTAVTGQCEGPVKCHPLLTFFTSKQTSIDVERQDTFSVQCENQLLKSLHNN